MTSTARDEAAPGPDDAGGQGTGAPGTGAQGTGAFGTGVQGTGLQATGAPSAAGLDDPLLGDAAALRARWLRVQAGFVDDPRQAVGDAADLIEQTAQALVGALRQRQRRLRVLWEQGAAGAAQNTTMGDAGGGPETAEGESAAVAESAADGGDTEHLRLMMQRYRSLFNQLCRP